MCLRNLSVSFSGGTFSFCVCGPDRALEQGIYPSFAQNPFLRASPGVILPRGASAVEASWLLERVTVERKEAGTGE